MRLRSILVTLILAAWSVAGPAAAAAGDRGDDATADAGRYWPQWRGPLGTGASPHGDPPVEWSEEKNVRWKVALPGAGHSTPIVWGERVFITAAEPFGEALPPRYDTAPDAHDGIPVTHRHRFLVLALGRRDGGIEWQRTVTEELPHEGGHYTGSYASASPATDGERLFAHFGSRGLYCLDLDGALLWKTDLGEMQTLHAHGEGSSPVLHGDTLAVNWDHEGGSFVAALDARTGKERWKAARDEKTSWASPIVVEHGGAAQLVVSGTNRVRGYDLATGKVIWECGGLSQNVVASPVAADGMVFAGSSYEKKALLAIRLEGARGDITGTDTVAWTRVQRTPYVPSPLLYHGVLYFLSHYQGILSRLEARTGEEPLRPVRLEGIRDAYSSPVAAADRVYLTDLDGTTVVLSHADYPRVLATNQLGEGFSASAAIAAGEVYLRGARHLYCIARE
jgi:outer membrane protein assembly factor BamB